MSYNVGSKGISGLARACLCHRLTMAPLPQRSMLPALCREWPEVAEISEVFLQAILPARFVGTGWGPGMRWLAFLARLACSLASATAPLATSASRRLETLPGQNWRNAHTRLGETSVRDFRWLG